MAPRIDMPVMRQVHRDPEQIPLWRRLLWWRAPVVYELAEPYEYVTWIDGKPVGLYMPAGFRSDLASTPRLSWLFGFRPDGILVLAAWYHDWYYRHGFFLGPACNRIFVGRGKRFADRVLARIVSETGGVRMPGDMAMAALTLFGWFAWRHNQQYRDRVAASPDAVELQGDYRDG